MQKILLLSLLVCFQSVFSQVSMEKNKLTKEGQVYKMSQYKEVFKNQEAINSFKHARTNKTLANIFAFTGGFGIGFSITQIIATPNEVTRQSPYGGTFTSKNNKSGLWTVLAIGSGLAVVSVPIFIASKKSAQKAMKLENGEPKAFQPYLKVETAGNGLALSYHF